MADDGPSYIEQWRNALADDMGQRAAKPLLLDRNWSPTMESNLGDFARSAPLALGGFRAPVPTSTAAQALAMKPIPRKADMSMGDNGVPQHVYEALLGRTRSVPGEPASPGSGWWHVGGQSIPKPTNVLPWLASAAGGYGIWNALGGPDLVATAHDPPWMKPGTKEYEERWSRYPDDPNYAGNIARIDAQHAERELAKQLGVARPGFWSDLFSLALSPDQQAEMDRRRLPGGAGSEPY